MRKIINLVILIGLSYQCNGAQISYPEQKHVYSYNKFLSLVENNEMFEAIEMIPNMNVSEQLVASLKLLECIRDNNQETWLVHLCHTYPNIQKNLTDKEKQIVLEAQASSMDIDEEQSALNTDVTNNHIYSKKRPRSGINKALENAAKIPAKKKKALIEVFDDTQIEQGYRSIGFNQNSLKNAYELLNQGKIFEAIDLIPSLSVGDQLEIEENILGYIRKTQNNDALVYLCSKVSDITEDLNPNELEIISESQKPKIEIDLTVEEDIVDKNYNSSVITIDDEEAVTTENIDLITEDSEEGQLLLGLITMDHANIRRNKANAVALEKHLKIFSIDKYVYRLIFIYQHKDLFLNDSNSYQQENCNIRKCISSIYNSGDIINYLIKNNLIYLLSELFKYKEHFHMYFSYLGSYFLSSDFKSIKSCSVKDSCILALKKGWHDIILILLHNGMSVFRDNQTSEKSGIASFFEEIYSEKDYELIIKVVKFYIKFNIRREINPFKFAFEKNNMDLLQSLIVNCLNYEDVTNWLCNAIRSKNFDQLNFIIDIYIKNNFFKEAFLLKELFELLFSEDRYDIIDKLVNYAGYNNNSFLRSAFVVTRYKCHDIKKIHLYTDLITPNILLLTEPPIVPLDLLIAHSSLKFIEEEYERYKKNTYNNHNLKKLHDEILCDSARYGRLDVINFLVDRYKENPDKEIFDITPECLEIACKNLKIEVASFLLKLNPELRFLVNDNLFDCVLFGAYNLSKNRYGGYDDILIVTSFSSLFLSIDIDIINNSIKIKNAENIYNNNTIIRDKAYDFYDMYCLVLKFYLNQSDANFWKFYFTCSNIRADNLYIFCEILESINHFKGMNLLQNFIYSLDGEASLSINNNFYKMIKYMIKSNISTENKEDIKFILITLLNKVRPLDASNKRDIVEIIKSGDLVRGFECIKDLWREFLVSNRLGNLAFKSRCVSVAKYNNPAKFKAINNYLNDQLASEMLFRLEIFFEKDELMDLFIDLLYKIYNENSCIDEYLRYIISNHRDIKGNTILHYLYKQNDIRFIKYVISEFKDMILYKNRLDEATIDLIVYNKPMILKELLKEL